MALNYRNLDARTRVIMLTEIDRDVASQSLYISDNLNPQGRIDYPRLLKEAAQLGDDARLAVEIDSRLNTHEKPRQLKGGGYSKPPLMRRNAHEMLAEGEFNRFYIRAVCVRAIEDGNQSVIVYRAKQVDSPRPESEVMIGQTVLAQQLLDDLRSHPGVDTAFHLPPGPNSGLSVQLP